MEPLAMMLGLLLLLLAPCRGDDGDHGDFIKREHSLMKPYQGVGSSPGAQWDITGNTVVIGHAVRLTADQQSKLGAMWNTVPCHVTDWEMHVHFKVHGQGKKNLHGDGFAVWYTKDKMQLGSVFGSRDPFHGLAIFVDTYRNDFDDHDRLFPFVTAMVNNGSLRYDHSKDGKTTEIGGCYADLRNKDYDTYMAVRYSRQRLTVMLDVDNRDEWRECLDVAGVSLPTGYHFGASAVTGDLSDNHDVVSLKLYELSVERPAEDSEVDRSSVLPAVDLSLVQRASADDSTGSARTAPMSGWRLFLLLLCALLAVVVCAVVGLLIYQRRQEHSRKRFY
ncbi:vesicular integral-membrane protein VIP36-like isoform X1 [Lampetra fluviatilis]